MYLLDPLDEVVAHGAFDKFTLIGLDLLGDHFFFLLVLDALLVSLQLLQVLLFQFSQLLLLQKFKFLALTLVL